MSILPSAVARSCGVVLSLLIVSGAWAQALPRGPERDRERGEDDEIVARERWWVAAHGLDTTRDAAGLRADAMRQQQYQLAHRAPALLATGPRWTSLGPRHIDFMDWSVGYVAGRVTALAPRPGDDSVLYLGTAAGGLWKSTASGTGWQRLSDSFDSPAIGAVLVATGATPAQDQVWVGTGEPYADGCYGYFGRGLYYSSNGGASFTPRNGSGANTLNLSVINGLARRPGSAQLLLAGGFGRCGADGTSSGAGIYRTTDNGANWTKVLASANVMDVIWHPTDASVAYASANAAGIYKSTDAGVTWTRLTNGIPNGSSANYVRLALAESSPDTLYALAGSPTGLYKSTDAGTTWTLVNAHACEGQCWYNLTLDVHPADANRLLIGTIRPAQSTDGGATLNYITETFGPTQRVHQDTHVVRWSRMAGNAQRLWVGSDGGLWRSDDAGGNYTNLSDGLNVAQYYDIALDPRDPEHVFGGAQDDASQARVAGDEWTVTVQTGDGFMNAIETNTGSDNGRRVFQTSYPGDGPSIYKSPSYGASGSFDYLATTGIDATENFPWVTSLAITKGYLYVASNYVYRAATNQSPSAWTWTKISPDFTGDTYATVSVIELARADGVVPLRAYVGTDNGRVWRSDDALATTPAWTEVTHTLPPARITDLAATPGAPDVVFATRNVFGADQLYRSTNGGDSWTAVGAGLPNVPANSVVVDSADPLRVFVGTDIGVYESRDRGSTFAPMLTGLPLGTVVTDLELSANPHLLVAGTFGSGAWKYDLSAPSDRIFAWNFEPTNQQNVK